ncbi:MAG: Sir2 family NAD-dependent protein deacetylase [Acidobacteriota bacterium]
MSDNVQILAEAIEGVGDGFFLVVTGAGISLASGIPTFRGSDPDAVWKRDVTELGTFHYFQEDPLGSWQWYMQRFEKVLGAQPNPAHEALVALERWQLGRGGRYLLVTQNIDTLHRAAGASELVEVHGRADRVRCPVDGCRHGAPYGSLPRADFDLTRLQTEPSIDALPRCPECGTILRQHVLWFDEVYTGHEDYQWLRVQAAASAMRLVLFVGTSFAVGVTELFVQQGLLGRVPIYSIDPGATEPPYPGIQVLADKAEELLPAVCERLGAT